MLIRCLAPRRRPQRGLSVVEMMVGIAVGLFVVAVATLMVGSQLGENRKLLIDTQLQQDLRATADIITRELRRAGAWTDAETGVASTVLPSATQNPQTTITVSSSPGAVTYMYSRSGVNPNSFGFRLANGAIEAQMATTSGYQKLTDETTMVVDTFQITEQDSTAFTTLPIACQKLCSDGTSNCWPTAVVRSLAFSITAHSASDTSVTRSINSTVRLRNDVLRFNNGTSYCPT